TVVHWVEAEAQRPSITESAPEFALPPLRQDPRGDPTARSARPIIETPEVRNAPARAWAWRLRGWCPWTIAPSLATSSESRADPRRPGCAPGRCRGLALGRSCGPR